MIGGQRDEALRRVAALGEQDGLSKLASPGQAYAFFGDDASGFFVFFPAEGQISQDVIAVDYGRARMYFGVIDGDAHGLTDTLVTDAWEEPVVKHVIDNAVGGGSGTTYAYYGDDASGTMTFMCTDASLGQHIDGVYYDRANMYVGIIDGEQYGLTEERYWFDGDDEVKAIAADIMGFELSEPEEIEPDLGADELPAKTLSRAYSGGDWRWVKQGDGSWRLMDGDELPRIEQFPTIVTVDTDGEAYYYRIDRQLDDGVEELVGKRYGLIGDFEGALETAQQAVINRVGFSYD